MNKKENKNNAAKAKAIETKAIETKTDKKIVKVIVARTFSTDKEIAGTVKERIATQFTAALDSGYEFKLKTFIVKNLNDSLLKKVAEVGKQNLLMDVMFLNKKLPGEVAEKLVKFGFYTEDKVTKTGSKITKNQLALIRAKKHCGADNLHMIVRRLQAVGPLFIVK